MFDNFKLLMQWFFDSLSSIWSVMLTSWGCIGVCIIGFPVLRKLVSIFRKIF